MQKQLAYFPLKVLLTFLVVTELLIWLGPVKFDISNPFTLALYLALMNFALYFGYKKGVKKFKPTCCSVSPSLIKIVILAGFLLYIYNLYTIWALHGLEVSAKTLVNALINPGEAYYSESTQDIDTSLLGLCFSPVKWAAIPFGIFYWKRASNFYRSFVVLMVLMEIITWLGIGTRKGLIDICLIFFFCLIALQPSLIQEKKSKRLIMITILSLGIAFLIYFIFSNMSRSGNDDFSELAEMSSGQFRVFYDNLPLGLTVALSFIVRYLCQGYYALSVGLKLGIIPLAPMGMSWFTIAIANKFGYDPLPNTYMAQLECFNIDMTVNWHSIYLWLANDFSFIGVPIIIYLIGYFLAQTWCDSVAKKNIYAFPIMTLFVIMTFYFFANNQVLSFSFLPFVICFTAYKLSTKIRYGY